MNYFCSIGSQILYIFETHGIGQTPSSLERYLVTAAFSGVSDTHRMADGGFTATINAATLLPQ